MIVYRCNHCKKDFTGDEVPYQWGPVFPNYDPPREHLHWWCLLPYLYAMGAPADDPRSKITDKT